MDWVQGFTITGNKTWLDSQSILKIDPMGQANGLNVECMKKRESKHVSRVVSLRNGAGDVQLTEMGTIFNFTFFEKYLPKMYYTSLLLY